MSRMNNEIPPDGLLRNIRPYPGESNSIADRFADLQIDWKEVVFIGIYGKHEDMFTIFPANPPAEHLQEYHGREEVTVVYGHTHRIELQNWDAGKAPCIAVTNESDSRITLTIRLSSEPLRRRVDGQGGAHIVDRMGLLIPSPVQIDESDEQS